MSEQVADMLAGLLFGLGFGIIIGHWLLWPVHAVEDGIVPVQSNDDGKTKRIVA